VPDPVSTAATLADEVLFPNAVAIDRAALVPVEHLDRVADAGLYGLWGPVGAGGLDADPAVAGRVAETLAGGSLAVTFVWIQHHSAVRALRTARPELRDRWLADLCSGRVRAGIAVAALRRPGPPAMTAEPDGAGGWRLTGWAPWVTGWGRIDVVLVAARAGDQLVWALVDARVGPRLGVEAQELAAMSSTGTVTLRLDGLAVGADRVIEVEPFAEWQARDALGLRANGYLPLGVAGRAARLLGSGELAEQIEGVRAALEGPYEGVPDARAAASVLAVRAASAVVAAGGGRSVDLGDHGQRLAREAMFLLVFGQTRPVRAAQLRVLGTGGHPNPAAARSAAPGDTVGA
jgi:hypothetical protein